MKNCLAILAYFALLVGCLATPSTKGGTVTLPDTVVTRAGQNVTLTCEAAKGAYILLLQWKYSTSEQNMGHLPTDVDLVEYRAESTTVFHHEGRMSLEPESFNLSFRPVQASDSGWYTCRVNNRDSTQTRRQLIVQDVPDPPGRPFTGGFTSRSVELSWTPPKSSHYSPISHYIIHIREGEDGTWDIVNGRATMTNATEFNVENLSPFTVYSFRVVAVNTIGQSKPSVESYYIVTLREVPEGKPIFTAAHNSSSTSIELHWKPPPQSTIHGEFSGYRITVRPREDEKAPVKEDALVIIIKDPKVTSTTIKGLRTYTQYLVSLQVFNLKGNGPTSTIAVMTNEGAPGPPENLKVLKVSDRSVELEWSPPVQPNGEIRGYWIYYKRGNFTSVKTHHIADPKAPVTYTLLDIEPNTKYVIWTKAYTQQHEGNSSESIEVETDYSGPGSPIISNLTCQNDTELFLHWLRPAQVYGSVDLYYISYRPENSFEFEEIAVHSVNDRLKHRFLITNLSVNTMYEVKVRGGTYSRFDSNKTYKGSFSDPRKILVFTDCHKANAEVPFDRLEMSAGIIAGIFCASFAILLLCLAMIIWRRFFQGTYYYLDEPPKAAPVLIHDWESDTGGDNQFGPVSVHAYAMHVANLHADGDIGFSKEYEAIQAASAQEQLPAEHSHHPDNKQKNRYLNIVAYDHTRVPLRPLPGQKKALEYVNANYIDGYDIPHAYIGTQGPLPSTFDTFWRMVWEQRVYIIVMITNLVERGRKKCDQYWPKEGSETYGFIQVRLVNEEVLATYTIRKFALKHLKIKCKKSVGAERIVYQYHYTNWPDHGTPEHPLPVLSFVRKSAAANPEDAGPIIVHCSAGVGRTGTYIVLDAILQQVRIKGILNVWGFLKHIRTQRNFLVQTEEQYIFIHDALVEAIQSGDTCIPKSGINRYIRMLQSSGGTQEKPLPWYLLAHQYKLVTHFQPRDFNVVSAVKPVNREKNRILDHLPLENGRVHLTPKPGVDGSDYINATWLMGYYRLREFVLTQHPLMNTVLDFWQMVWDHNAQTIVVLSPVDETLGFPQFWPTSDEDFDSELWKVHYLEERVHSGLVTIELVVQSLQDDYEFPVRLIQAPGWPQTIPALNTTLSLVCLVQEAHTNYQNGPLVIVDKFGCTEGATFASLFTLKCQGDFENHVDPYMYMKLYHNRRPSIWSSQAYFSTEGSNSSSSCDMAGFSDPVITMPPVTSLAVIPSPNTFVNPESVPLPISPQSPLPPNGCANGQVIGIVPVGIPPNGYPTVAGNGILRVPPDGKEDAPQIVDVPPV